MTRYDGSFLLGQAAAVVSDPLVPARTRTLLLNAPSEVQKDSKGTFKAIVDWPSIPGWPVSGNGQVHLTLTYHQRGHPTIKVDKPSWQPP